VLIAVFSVSLIFETIIAKGYLSNFLKQLRQQIEKGENNSASCEYLGISEIYRTRDKFEMAYPFERTITLVTPTSKIRIVAVSMFLIMTKSDLLKEAIEKGCSLELALLDPKAHNEDFENIQELDLHDIQATINRFKKTIVKWIISTKPKGSIQLRMHNITLLDSFSSFEIQGKEFGAWDLSFGSDTRRKRVFIVDLKGRMGLDLIQRYNRIWESGTPVFVYENNEVKTNIL
jgi:hypothetical protein